MALEATTGLAIGQWADSPRLLSAIRAPIDVLEEDVLGAHAELELMRHIDTAEGVWLDYLGARVGIRRPSTTDASSDTRFGFDDAGVGFDQAPFSGDEANEAVFPLRDAVFRAFVKARAALVLGDGTVQTFARAVRFIDPSALVQDQRDMSVRVVTSRRSLIELADTSHALPRSAGVRINYVDRGRFGFDDAGVAFDQGPFRVTD